MSFKSNVLVGVLLLYVHDNGPESILCFVSELIITAGGENIAPVPIEAIIKEENPLISNAMVIGDKRKFLSCLLTLKVTYCV